MESSCKCPNDIAVDSQGLMYVTDFDKHNIQNFSPDGKFISQFATRDGPEQLMKPVCVTIDTATTGLVYVSKMGSNRTQSLLVMACLCEERKINI